MRIEPGALIDGYTLEEQIHQGSMATLWRVSAPDQPSLVMKMPLLRQGDDPTAMVGFEVEQMIMPVLHGPHVPRFIASADFTAQPYIVMEHIRGESLRPRLEHSRQLIPNSWMPAARNSATNANLASRH